MPARMMGITACRDVGFNAALGTRGQCCRAKVASIQRRCLRSANLRRNSRQRGFGLLAIVGVIGKGTSDNEQTPLINRYLRVVILLKARMRRAFHDARLRVGEIVLVAIAWSGRWRTRRTTTGATSRRSLSFLALLQLSLILRLLDCIPLLGTGFQYRFGLRQSHQAILSPCDLFAHHQPVRHLWLLTLFTESK